MDGFGGGYLLRFIYTLLIVVVTLSDKTTGKVQISMHRIAA